MKKLDEIKGEMYNILLAARTEGIIHGKTKYFAESDTDDILSTVINKGGVCPECKGEPVFVTDKWHPAGFNTYPVSCPKCNGTGKLPDITVKDAIERINKE